MVDRSVWDERLFLEANSPQDDALLEELVRETHRCTVHPRMLGGNVLNAFIGLLIDLLQPERILEIGSFTGYTTISMARRAPQGCRIDTIEYRPEHAAIARRFFCREGLGEERVRLLEGDAMGILPTLTGPYELVFMDADKAQYPAYLKGVIPLLPVGGLLLADNALWGGKVANGEVKDRRTTALREFLRMLHDDPRLESTLQPMHDGLAIVRRIA